MLVRGFWFGVAETVKKTYVPDREGNDEYIDARDSDYEFG